MKSRIDIVGQNGNDGLHYDKEWDEIKPAGLEFEYELDKSTGEVVKKYHEPTNDLEKILNDNHNLQSNPHGFSVSDYVKKIKEGRFKQVRSMLKPKFKCNRFCGENECNEKQNENPMLCKRVTDKLHEDKPSDEFTWWYERFFCQSPSMCALQYDDEKMWEAWKAGQKAFGQMIKDNAELGGKK